MNKPTRTILAIVALAAATAIQAQAPAEKAALPDGPKIDFSTVDKDANGKLSKEETLPIAELEGAFDKLDTDHDGSVSPAEFARWSRAGKASPVSHDPTTAPSGSAGAQHMPSPN
ncbi:MAG TPA: EF-hand domain-containing protein [Steroidobacteraceae bacterium]|nr:EF-hand domain-containing protein [Steroidobacteraceae bacterium]